MLFFTSKLWGDVRYVERAKSYRKEIHSRIEIAFIEFMLASVPLYYFLAYLND